MAPPRQGLVESYRSWSVSAVETSTPATLRRSLPVVMPSARTKKAGQQLCLAEELGQLSRLFRRLPRPIGAGLGVLLDRLLGEPPTPVHPVALFGRAMQSTEQRIYRDKRVSGAVHATVGTALGAGAGALAGSTTLATAIAVGGQALVGAALDVSAALAAGDEGRARELLPALVGRDPSGLHAAEIARAAVESVAENTVDAIVAPALWAALAGAPGPSGTGPLTLWTPWSGTVRRATCTTAGPVPGSTTSPIGYPPVARPPWWPWSGRARPRRSDELSPPRRQLIPRPMQEWRRRPSLPPSASALVAPTGTGNAPRSVHPWGGAEAPNPPTSPEPSA
jgi:hypothetical protein